MQAWPWFVAMASPFHVYLQLRLFGEFKLTLPLYLQCSEPSWALPNINWPVIDHAHHKQVTLAMQSKTRTFLWSWKRPDGGSVELVPVVWMRTRKVNMNRDWLLQRSTWSFLACSKFPVIFPWQLLLQVVSPQRNVAYENSRFSSLLAARWRRFERRNVCDSATEIPYWWRKICPESGHKRWLVDGVVTLFSYCLRMTGKSQKATEVNIITKQSIFVEYSLL